MVEGKKVIEFDDVTRLFGVRSRIFHAGMKYLEKKSISRKEKFDKKLQKWQEIFLPIYGKDLDPHLFIRHTYFALVLKVLIIQKLALVHNLDLEDAYEDSLSNNLESFRTL